MPYVIVFLGAGIGGALRHGMNVLVGRILGYQLPVATFAVNVIGSFLVGVLAGYFLQRTGVPQPVRLFLVTGVLGGFTTFSTFSLDTAVLLERQSFGWAAAYAVGSVLASLVAVLAGLFICRSAAHLP